MVGLQEAEDITPVLLQGKWLPNFSVYKLELIIASEHFLPLKRFNPGFGKL